MIIRTMVSLAALGTAAWLATGPVGAAPPDRVPLLTERALSRTAYAELARAWKAYMDEHGETVEGLVNLGMAYGYGNRMEAAEAAGRRAVEIGPNDPGALAFLGKTLNTRGAPPEETTPLLERAVSLDPDNLPALQTLAGIHLRNGRLEPAQEVLKNVFTQHLIPRPLQDYAYNMLVGLPRGAVLITNGDNDTFPPLALQTGMDFRTDVVIVNRSLLNAPDYAEAVFAAHPELRPEKVPEPDGMRAPSAGILEGMVEQTGAPLYFSTTTSLEDLRIDTGSWQLDGLNLRSGRGGLSAEENAMLFLDRFRLDSATDWTFAWDLTPNLVKFMMNYVAGMMRGAEREGLPSRRRDDLLDRAGAIAEFHRMEGMLARLEAMRKP